ncbi:hypothetical protein CRG98_034350 [Punica granatum]|uniref:Uncharacterized protein n=1 Tax=Punica granatum TaxID=22663 RepID=A0A2I0INK8_PUNGR|nr:hypothetical protein CRG98_034350 [Punica granatum]
MEDGKKSKQKQSHREEGNPLLRFHAISAPDRIPAVIPPYGIGTRVGIQRSTMPLFFGYLPSLLGVIIQCVGPIVLIFSRRMKEDRRRTSDGPDDSDWLVR